jgi:glycerol-3-phosphate acyltransferase PlsY
VGLSAFAVFGVVLLISRMVSLSSVIAVSTVFLFAPLTHEGPVFYGAFAMVVTGIWVKHGENLQRIRNGTERKVSFSKKQGSIPPEDNKDDREHGHAG